MRHVEVGLADSDVIKINVKAKVTARVDIALTVLV